MFEQLKITTTTPKTKSPKSLVRTTEFVRTLVKEGYRISYTALRNAAHDLGEDNSQQKAPQRGAYLANALEAALQPFVTRKNGTYHEKAIAKWTVETPADLGNRPVINKDVLPSALAIWLENEAEADDADVS